MPKLDLKKKYPSLYTAKTTPVFVDPVPMNRIFISGQGDPEALPEFGQAIEALFGTAFALARASREKREDRDFTVMPLEALWWAEDISAFCENRRDEWLWTLFICLPDFIGNAAFHAALETMKAKKDNPALEKIRFDLFSEPHAAQVLHVGPYEDEAATIKLLHDFIAGTPGHTILGKHHEIYLSNPRRTAPEKLKTILRQPVKRECAIQINTPRPSPRGPGCGRTPC